jgi:hypothetical protein
MKKVYIDNSKSLVIVDGKQVPRLLLRMIRGAIGKSFVVKRYRGGRVVVTKYPDMSGIVASEKQRLQRDLFQEAVVYAKWIMADEERKKAFRKSLPRRKQKRVYHAAIQLYMRMHGDKQWLKKQLAVKSMLRAQQGDKHEAITKRQWTMGNQQWLSGAEYEASKPRVACKQQGAWSLNWQKKEEMMHTAEKEGEDAIKVLRL